MIVNEGVELFRGEDTAVASGAWREAKRLAAEAKGWVFRVRRTHTYTEPDVGVVLRVWHYAVDPSRPEPPTGSKPWNADNNPSIYVSHNQQYPRSRHSS